MAPNKQLKLTARPAVVHIVRLSAAAPQLKYVPLA
jgi:hypothetical protein